MGANAIEWPKHELTKLNSVLHGAATNETKRTSEKAPSKFGREFTGPFTKVPVPLLNSIARYLEPGELASWFKTGGAFLDRRFKILKGHDKAIHGILDSCDKNPSKLVPAVREQLKILGPSLSSLN